MPKPGLRLTLLALLFLFGTSRGAAANAYYTSPSGHPSGDGSIGNPWNLATALAQPAAVRPGDTIWLRGGSYPGTFSSSLTGSAGSPILVRQYPGERAILDGGNSGGRAVLTVAGAYTWYWGFEIMSSDPTRVSASNLDNPPDIGRGDGIDIDQSTRTGSGLKFINLVIHDTRQGVSFWTEAIDAEIYGCLIYYNGWDAPARGSGHGIYAQNQTGTKKLGDNILFSGFGYGIHAYGSSSSFLDNFLLQGNTIFNSGNLSVSGPSRVLLLGGDSVAHSSLVFGNLLYRQTGGTSSDFDMGFSAGCAGPTVTGNYVATTTLFVNCTSGLTLTGNTFYGNITGFARSAFPANTYFSLRPTGTQVFLRPNLYETGRANLTIYNWDRNATVNVDLSIVLPVGSQYEIRNAQDFFAPPVKSGTYSGGTVSLPMAGLSVASPVGALAPLPTGPDFNAFVLLQTAPPPATATSLYTVAPCRIVDTRGPNGSLGGPFLASGAIRTFVLINQCGIPPTAKAVSANVAVTQPTKGPGFLTVYPGGTVSPPPTSTVNYKVGQTRSNYAIVSLGAAGDVSVYSAQGGGTTHVIIDVTGYFR